MMTWGIWHQRNQVLLYKACYSSNLITVQAKERLDEFHATLPPKPPTMPRTRVIRKPPNASYFKINFDGVVFRNENRSGIGMVIRDHTSSIIASLAQLIVLAFQPTKIKAIAAAQALEFGQEIGISGATLEGDSELIIDSLKARGHTMTSVEPLFQDTVVFSNFYSKLLYSHCRREGNILAHNLTRYLLISLTM